MSSVRKLRDISYSLAAAATSPPRNSSFPFVLCDLTRSMRSSYSMSARSIVSPRLAPMSSTSTSIQQFGGTAGKEKLPASP